MTQHRRRLIERVTDPSYLERHQQRSLEDLRAMRDECREGENELSFERRLCQARMEILAAELQRRESRGPENLVERLPEILARSSGGTSAPLPSRAPNFSIPRNADVPRRRIEDIAGEQTLARLTTLGAAEVEQILRSLEEHERSLSARRKAIHDVMDLIQAEIVRRYQSGEADPSSILA